MGTMQELDTVVLTATSPSIGSGRTNVGAVVHVYGGGKALEVEFVTAAGETQTLLTMKAEDVRPRPIVEPA